MAHERTVESTSNGPSRTDQRGPSEARLQRSDFVVLAVVGLAWVAGVIWLGKFFAGYTAGAVVSWVFCCKSLDADWRWWKTAEERLRTDEIDGPFEVEWTRFGFIWGPLHVERIGDTDTKRVGIYVTNAKGESVTYTCTEDGTEVQVSKEEANG